MQLTAKLAILASAVALSAPAVFSLPIEYDIDARDVADVGIDAREVDELEFTARELINQYHEAREFYDELDARAYQDELDARAYVDELELEAREFYEYLMTRAASSTDADNTAFTKVHNDKKAEVKTIASVSQQTVDKVSKDVPDFKQVHTKLVSENTFLQQETVFTPPTRDSAQATKSLANKQKRLEHLKLIAKDVTRWDSLNAGDKAKFKKAVADEKKYQETHEKAQAAKGKRSLDNYFYARDNHNAHLDPALAKVLTDSTKNGSPIFQYAQQANRELEAYQKLQTDSNLKNTELKVLIDDKFTDLEKHITAIKAKDPVALADSAEYRAKLARITSGQDSAAIKEKKDKADRLERILKNPNSKSDIQAVIKDLKAKKTTPKSKLRRRRF